MSKGVLKRSQILVTKAQLVYLITDWYLPRF